MPNGKTAIPDISSLPIAPGALGAYATPPGVSGATPWGGPAGDLVAPIPWGLGPAGLPEPTPMGEYGIPPGVSAIYGTDPGSLAFWAAQVEAAKGFQGAHPAARGITDPDALAFVMSLQTDEAGNVMTPMGAFPLEAIINIVATTPFTAHQLAQMAIPRMVEYKPGEPRLPWATQWTGERTPIYEYPIPFTSYLQQKEYTETLGEKVPAYLKESLAGLKPTPEYPYGEKPYAGFGPVTPEYRREREAGQRRRQKELQAKTTYPFLAEQQQALRGIYESQLPTFAPAGRAYWGERFSPIFQEFGKAYKEKPARTERGVEEQFRSHLATYPFMEKFGEQAQARGYPARFAPRARWLTY